MKPLRWLLLISLLSPWLAHGEVAIYRETDDRFWFVASVAQMDVDYRGYKLEPAALGFRLGGDVFDYMGAEIRYATGVGRGRDRVREGEEYEYRQSRLNHNAAALLIAMIPVHNDWEGRGYLGLGNTNISSRVRRCGPDPLREGPDVCEMDHRSGSVNRAAWGFGARWRPFREMGLTLDFMDYGGSKQDVRTFEIGGVFFF